MRSCMVMMIYPIYVNFIQTSSIACYHAYQHWHCKSCKMDWTLQAAFELPIKLALHKFPIDLSLAHSIPSTTAAFFPPLLFSKHKLVKQEVQMALMALQKLVDKVPQLSSFPIRPRMLSSNHLLLALSDHCLQCPRC